MISKIDFEIIYPVWRNLLWPERKSLIESTSAMNYLGGYDIKNLEFQPTFFGYFIDGNLVGVNSGHRCKDNSYRSRGLFVNENYRQRGIGKSLLEASINQAIEEHAEFVWSYPKYTAYRAYIAAGFSITSPWEQSELGQNAYCKKDL